MNQILIKICFLKKYRLSISKVSHSILKYFNVAGGNLSTITFFKTIPCSNNFNLFFVVVMFFVTSRKHKTLWGLKCIICDKCEMFDICWSIILLNLDIYVLFLSRRKRNMLPKNKSQHIKKNNTELFCG